MLLQSPVLAPAVGLAGVIIGAVLTQLLSLKRERLQWKRQQESDDIRWTREKEERIEQWRREDSSRWESERLAAYSEVLSHVESWTESARKHSPLAIAGRGRLSRAAEEELRLAEERVDYANTAIELLAPERIKGNARSIYMQMTTFRLELSEWPVTPPGGERTDEELDSRARELRGMIDKRHRRLRDEMRDDLGIKKQDTDS